VRSFCLQAKNRIFGAMSGAIVSQVKARLLGGPVSFVFYTLSKRKNV
jgi:hypothetical protein